MRVTVLAGLLLLLPVSASASDIGVLIESTSTARRFEVTRTRRVERAIRQVVGRDVEVRRRDRLSGEAAECSLEAEACRRLLRRTLHADRVLVVRLSHARGACVPMVRRGRRVGRRMLVDQVVGAGWLGGPVSRRRVPHGANAEAWLDLLKGEVEQAMAGGG